MQKAATAGGPSPKNEVTVKIISLSQRLLASGRTVGISRIVVIILVFFLLAYGDDLRVRMLRSLGDTGKRKKVQAVILEVEHEVSMYLGTVTAINLGLGIAISVALHLLGFPNAALWGTIAAFANFMPISGRSAPLASPRSPG